ncbi:MAG: hypothetical protein EPO35_09380 [Acidobacteria bacterium]|nr:MAG: hypothetical protein EPO35_09380 [Acidobacteriota bacterium]
MNLFLLMRVVHILLAAIWFGAAVAMMFFVIPAIKDAKQAGGAVMAGVMSRKYPAIMQSIAGTTILTGFYLYWRFTGGFDPVLSASMGGRVFGTGAVSGILALIIGATLVAGSMKKAAAAMAKAGSMPDGPEKAALVASVAPLQARAEMFGRIVIVLMVIAIVTMSIGHYV